MACGICIVTTNVGGIPYLIVQESDALLVTPNDPKAMADAISYLLTEPGLAERIALNAHSRVKQFDWSNVLPQWERVLLEVSQQNKNRE